MDIYRLLIQLFFIVEYNFGMAEIKGDTEHDTYISHSSNYRYYVPYALTTLARDSAAP